MLQKKNESSNLIIDNIDHSKKVEPSFDIRIRSLNSRGGRVSLKNSKDVKLINRDIMLMSEDTQE